MSAMRSASSMMTMLTSATDTSPCWSRSIMRPGVATTRSTPCSSSLRWRLDAGAAVDADDRAVDRRAERRELLAHLHRELAGGDERDARWAGSAWPWPRLASTGQAEGERLAGARLGLAAHVSPGEGVGDRERLDREGLLDAARAQGLDQLGGNAECGEAEVSLCVQVVRFVRERHAPPGEGAGRSSDRRTASPSMVAADPAGSAHPPWQDGVMTGPRSPSRGRDAARACEGATSPRWKRSRGPRGAGRCPRPAPRCSGAPWPI